MSRALVLSGGGPVGIAWETGIVAGLAAEGIVLAEADRFVGTSAGSVVGAQIAAGADVQQLVERHLEPGAFGERRTSEQPQSAAPDMSGFMQAMAELFTSDAPPEERRRKIGAFALSASTPPEDAFVSNISSLLGPQDTWPSGFSCTAVDAATGAFIEWDAGAGVDLGRAVASSCAVPGIFPPITIGDGRYIDGGMRSIANADLAKGYERVVVLSLIGGERASMFGPVAEALNQEVAELEGAGATVEVIAPDEAAAAVMGVNLMDPSVSPKAAEAGIQQGKACASRLRDLWA